MKMLKAVGIFLIVLGIAVGLYAGIWWGLIGGIIATVEAIRAPELVGKDLALGIVRFVFSEVIGLVCGAIIALPGYVLSLQK